MAGRRQSSVLRIEAGQPRRRAYHSTAGAHLQSQSVALVGGINRNPTQLVARLGGRRQHRAGGGHGTAAMQNQVRALGHYRARVVQASLGARPVPGAELAGGVQHGDPLVRSPLRQGGRSVAGRQADRFQRRERPELHPQLRWLWFRRGRDRRSGVLARGATDRSRRLAGSGRAAPAAGRVGRRIVRVGGCQRACRRIRLTRGGHQARGARGTRDARRAGAVRAAGGGVRGGGPACHACCRTCRTCGAWRVCRAASGAHRLRTHCAP